MTQDNPPIARAVDPSTAASVPGNESTPLPQPRSRKRRWLRRIVGLFFVLLAGLITLIAAAPTVLSTGAARGFLLGKANEHLNGRVVVSNWSISWTGGVVLEGVKVFDATDRQVMEISRLKSALSLPGALRGNFHLGNTAMEGLDYLAERDLHGTLNFEKLMKTSNAAQPLRLPPIDGNIQLLSARGTYFDERKGQTVKYTTVSGDVKISNINSPIEYSLNIVAQSIGGSDSSSFTTRGTILLARDNVLLSPAEVNSGQTVDVKANSSATTQSTR